MYFLATTTTVNVTMAAFPNLFFGNFIAANNVLMTLSDVHTVEFLFVHSFSCRKTQNTCIFVLSGKKVNGQIRTLL